jgi:hypothetical protein
MILSFLLRLGPKRICFFRHFRQTCYVVAGRGRPGPCLLAFVRQLEHFCLVVRTNNLPRKRKTGTVRRGIGNRPSRGRYTGVRTQQRL